MTPALESVIESINTLSLEEKQQLWQILDHAIAQSKEPEPSTYELIQLSEEGKSLNFLYNEPDLYTLADGEPV